MSFHGFLKQSTNTIVGYGPFVASADGETAQTALTINQADIIIRKQGGNTWAQKAATGGATAVASGMYAVNVGTGDSGTVGKLDLFTHVSPALYVKQSYVVLPGLVYDSIVGGTDFLQTDSHQASGTNILTLLDNAISSRIAATAAVFDKVDVNVSSRIAATATGVGFLDVALSSRVAATAATWGNLDATVSSVYTKASGAATELGVGNIDVKTSSRLAATAASLSNLDVLVSSRAAATAASLSNLDVLVSSRMAGTATVSASFATATQVTDKTGYTIAAGGIPVGGFAAGAVNDAAVAADAETAFANAVKAAVVESAGSITLQQALSVMLSVLAGVTTASGATFKTSDGAATRVTSTLDANNQRTAITLAPSA